MTDLDIINRQWKYKNSQEFLRDFGFNVKTSNVTLSIQIRNV